MTGEPYAGIDRAVNSKNCGAEMARMEIRQLDDERGPYRWFPVIRTAAGLARGGIHDVADDLDPEEIATARSVCPPEFTLREVPA